MILRRAVQQVGHRRARVNQQFSKLESSPKYIIKRSYISIPDLFRNNEYEVPKDPPDNKIRASFVDGKYVSKFSQETEKSVEYAIKWLATRKLRKLEINYSKTHEEMIQPIPIDVEVLNNQPTPSLTWIGHSTCYVKMGGVNFLTDPVFSSRAFCSNYLGPKRLIEAGVAVEKLPTDVILLSHTHYDHLDITTAKKIGNTALWIVPLGVKSLLSSINIHNCIELDWWESYTIQSSLLPSLSSSFSPSLSPPYSREREREKEREVSITVTFTPAKHWTGRSLWDRNSCLWGGFAVEVKEKEKEREIYGMIEREKEIETSGSQEREKEREREMDCKFFFAGDTGYDEKLFKAIGTHLGPFDFAALPIGAYRPDWFLSSVHIDPSEAIRVHREIGCKQSVGIHWGTFPLADEDYIEPPLELARARRLLSLSLSQFFTMRHGETWCVGGDPLYDFATLYPELLTEYEALREGLKPPHKQSLSRRVLRSLWNRFKKPFSTSLSLSHSISRSLSPASSTSSS